jgi:amino acid adenylation domain-containing protein
LAYIIFTSGSTGLPKGASIEHHSLVHQIKSYSHANYLLSSDVILNVASFLFDLHVHNTFAGLGLGATIVLPSPRRELDFAYLLGLIHHHSVTYFPAVPSLLRAFLEFVDQNNEWKVVSLLRSITTVGEPAPPALCQLIRSKLPDVELLNGYGPTEIAVLSHMFSFRAPIVTLPIPIGRPLPGYTQFILDAEGEPVPVGVIGRLFIGGLGVFRGYLNRPDLTSKALARSDAVRGRLYDTGDLVRLRHDGELLFCGRDDFQVKIRGQRLELGEIESLLSSHPAVKQAVVMKQEDCQSHQGVLVAYTVLRGTAELDPDHATSSISSSSSSSSSVPSSDSGSLSSSSTSFLLSSSCSAHSPLVVAQQQLLALCKDRLAAYMVPSFWVFLPSFPLTGTGKVDRKRLPWPVNDPSLLVQSQDSGEVVEPRSELEHQLRSLFAEVLSRPESSLSVERSFFADYGGNSLMAAQLAAHISARLHVSLSIVEILKRQVSFSFSFHFLFGTYLRCLF